MAQILVYEDDPVVARLMRLLYSLEGHDVEVVTSGAQARSRLDADPPDLLVLDVMLDGEDGIELLRLLRERPAWERCRVIVVTALATDHDVWRGWSNGADYYLTKPFDMAHLRSVSDRLLHDEAAATGVARVAGTR